jgi:hypothetical protein
MYVVAPLADNVVLLPVHMFIELALAAIVGVFVTVIVMKLVPLQLPLVPVTEYVVVAVGYTVMLFPE